MYASFNILFLTEFSSIVPLATNIKEKMIKIAVFVPLERSTPLYEENFAIVESNIIIAVKTKMKKSVVFLVRAKVA